MTLLGSREGYRKHAEVDISHQHRLIGKPLQNLFSQGLLAHRFGPVHRSPAGPLRQTGGQFLGHQHQQHGPVGLRVGRIGLGQFRCMRHLQRGAVQNEDAAIPAGQRLAAAEQQMVQDTIGYLFRYQHRHCHARITIGSGMATYGPLANALVLRQQLPRMLLHNLLYGGGESCAAIQTLGNHQPDYQRQSENALPRTDAEFRFEPFEKQRGNRLAVEIHDAADIVYRHRRPILSFHKYERQETQKKRGYPLRFRSFSNSRFTAAICLSNICV